MRLIWLIPLAVLACAPAPEYTSPEDEALVGVRAYPSEGDVCQVIGESEETAELLDDTYLLIGCPAAARAALNARKSEGAAVLDQIGTWVLLAVPN